MLLRTGVQLLQLLLLLVLTASANQLPARKHTYNLVDFGGKGDGVTLNTQSFRAAVAAITLVAGDGGGLLHVPAGRWMTGPFNLTSHMTLFLDQHATILGTPNRSLHPLVAELPSYGGGARPMSLVHGRGLADVVIAGANGTIDGNGAAWWHAQPKEVPNGRGFLLEMMHCQDLVVTNITLQNSPSWTVHPYDCDRVSITDVTILAPDTSPNTDGIDPDSSRDVFIGNYYYHGGDDAIAVKSGIDCKGRAFNTPSANIRVENVTVFHATEPHNCIAIGSEISGGVFNVSVRNVQCLGQPDNSVTHTLPTENLLEVTDAGCFVSLRRRRRAEATHHRALGPAA